jgi:hypothetical protein
MNWAFPLLLAHYVLATHHLILLALLLMRLMHLLLLLLLLLAAAAAADVVDEPSIDRVYQSLEQAVDAEGSVRNFERFPWDPSTLSQRRCEYFRFH